MWFGFEYEDCCIFGEYVVVVVLIVGLRCWIVVFGEGIELIESCVKNWVYFVDGVDEYFCCLFSVD